MIFTTVCSKFCCSLKKLIVELVVVSVYCNFVLLIDFDDVRMKVFLSVYLYYCLQENHNCDLKKLFV